MTFPIALKHFKALLLAYPEIEWRCPMQGPWVTIGYKMQGKAGYNLVGNGVIYHRFFVSPTIRNGTFMAQMALPFTAMSSTKILGFILDGLLGMVWRRFGLALQRTLCYLLCSSMATNMPQCTAKQLRKICFPTSDNTTRLVLLLSMLEPPCKLQMWWNSG